MQLADRAAKRLGGVLAAAITPVDEDLAPDPGPFIEHCRWLLANGCDGLNVLGTTGGFASFTVPQRVGIMYALAKSGLPLGDMMVGTGAASLGDTVTLTKAAVDLKFAGALVIPPFYYKNVTAAGVFAYVSELIARVAKPSLRLYVYHFPAMSGVPFSFELLQRLIETFPDTIAGIKDSTSDMAFCERLHAAFPALDIFPSSETTLAHSREAGYAGCISASVNVTAPLAARVWRGQNSLENDALQTNLAGIRTAITAAPPVPALHHLVAELHGDPRFERLMPPLQPLAREERATLHRELAAAGYPADGARV